MVLGSIFSLSTVQPLKIDPVFPCTPIIPHLHLGHCYYKSGICITQYVYVTVCVLDWRIPRTMF